MTVSDDGDASPSSEPASSSLRVLAKRDDPAISRGLFLGTLAGLRALDVDIEPALEKVGLRVADLRQLPARLAPSALYDLWNALSETTGERGFGVRMAERIRPEQFALFGDVIATSATLGEALMRGLRLFGLISETVRFSAEFGERQAVLTLEVLHSGKVHPESVEFLLAAMVSVARRITGVHGRLLEARFSHERPGDVGYLERFFACPLRFASAESAIVLDSAVLLVPVIDHDAERCAALQREAESLLADMSQPGDLRRDVLNAISREIGNGDPSIDHVAARMGLHPKALARRLREDGITFRQLLEDVRFRLARRYLEQPEASITEIAFRLGYSEKSAFNRAFKRWAGTAPREFTTHGKRFQPR